LSAAFAGWVRTVVQRVRDASISLADAHPDARAGTVEALIAAEARITASFIMNAAPHIDKKLGSFLSFSGVVLANELAGI
jgi:hypothetical protein